MHGRDHQQPEEPALTHDSSPDGAGAIAPAPPGSLLPDPTQLEQLAPVAPAPSRPSRLGVLRHAHYRTIFIAAFGSYLGSWFEFVAIRWIVSQQTKSEAWMGYLAAAQLGPTLILGMFGGLVADSVNRKTLIVVTQVCMMLIALAMAAAAYFGFATPRVLLLLMLAHGIAVAFNMPAWQVLTPRLVPREDLSKAITLNGISFNAARVIGPATGGLIMKAFQGSAPVALAGTAIVAADALGPAAPAATESTASISRGVSALLLFNAITFIGVLLAVLTTPDAPAPAALRGAWKKPGIAWKRTAEALSWTWRRKGPRAALVAIVIFAVLATPIMQLMPLMVSEVYARQEDVFGLLLALMGCGAVVGGFAMKLIPKWYPMHHFIPVSILGAGLSILTFSLINVETYAYPVMFIIGIFWMWGFNACNVAIQHLVSEEMRGRVSAVVNSIALGLMPVGTWVASAAGHSAEHALKSVRPEWIHTGSATQLGLAIVSAALIVAALVMLIWRTPEVDGIEPGQPGYDRKPGLWRGITASAHRPRR
ncbi:MAG: MFS transporter [Phycisphaeraceae bacterium]|nr:MFS transporter [Phycisphaeraceae bacterium]